LPAVFTIGADVELESLKNYARLLAENTDDRNNFQKIVEGIIEGETRVVVSSMSMEAVFKERQTFENKGR
jgi:flotillin